MLFCIFVKAFYDILKSVAEQYGFLDEYTEEQYIALAQDVKDVVDDKTQYIDWDKKADIKAQLKVQIILTLAKHKYPPATRDDVFKAIFEQAENFKKNRSSLAPKLNNVEDDQDVRNLIFTRLQLDDTTSDLQLQREVIELFGERYSGMTLNDWRHIIEDYTPMVRRAAQPKAKEVSMRTYKMAAEEEVGEAQE